LNNGLVVEEGVEGKQVFHGNSEEALVIDPELDFDAIAAGIAQGFQLGYAAGSVPIIQGLHLGLPAPNATSDQAIAIKIDFGLVGIGT
jgi:hypothetical protein